MTRVLLHTGLSILALLLASCSSQPVYAPVGARDSTKTPAPASTTPAKPATTTSAPARTYRPPAGRPVARSGHGYHVVKRGETLYSIAWKYGLSYRELAAINHIRAPYTIYSGQRLRTSTHGRRPVAAATRADPRPVPARNAARTTPAKAAPAKAPAAAAAAAKPKPAPSPTPTSSTPEMPATQVVAMADKPLPDTVQHWVWPTRGKLLHRYKPDSEGKKGIDIGGTTGQNVMAAAEGKVVYAGSGLVGYGRLIIIKHTDSLLSAYGHNSKLLVTEGQHVKAGQTIARMGSSGTDRTQLYFEIRKDGKPVNPLRYLPRV